MCWVLFWEKGMAVMHWWCCSGRGTGILRLVCVPIHDWVQHGGFCSSLWEEQSRLCAQHNEKAVAVAFRQALPSTLPLSSSGLKPLVYLLSLRAQLNRPQVGDGIQEAMTTFSALPRLASSLTAEQQDAEQKRIQSHYAGWQKCSNFKSTNAESRYYCSRNEGEAQGKKDGVVVREAH